MQEMIFNLNHVPLQADWIERREFWNPKMQKRYEKRRREMWSKVPLKVSDELMIDMDTRIYVCA